MYVCILIVEYKQCSNSVSRHYKTITNKSCLEFQFQVRSHF